ncbi:MAG: CapA family protein [Bradymonadia bacterium]
MRLSILTLSIIHMVACGGSPSKKDPASIKMTQGERVSPFAPPSASTASPKARTRAQTSPKENVPIPTKETTKTVPAKREPISISLTFGGDISLNRSGQKPRSKGTGTGKNLTPWRDVTGGIIPFFKDSDLNFGNVETVVTPRNIKTRTRKKYTFQSHVAGFEYLITAGLNLLSLANNHSFDFGEQGARITLETFRQLKEKYPEINYAGLGIGEAQAAAPVIFQVKGKTIAFAAVGIISNMNLAHRTGPNKAGTLRFRDDQDYQLVINALKSVSADYKILSIHYGKEREVNVDAFQKRRFAKAFNEAGVDLVLGHHAHVVRGIQRRDDGKVGFYGLGNYMMRGARNMGPLPDAQDYGLFGKLVLKENLSTGRLYAESLTLHPLTEMHWNSRVMDRKNAERRLNVLNALSRKAFGLEGVVVGIEWGVGRIDFMEPSKESQMKPSSSPP